MLTNIIWEAITLANAYLILVYYTYDCIYYNVSMKTGEFTGIEGQSGKNMCQGGKPDTGKFHSSYIGMYVCGSAYENGCVVDGMCARAAYWVLILVWRLSKILIVLILIEIAQFPLGITNTHCNLKYLYIQYMGH